MCGPRMLSTLLMHHHNLIYDLRICYAHQRGIHFMIEQPMTSVSDLAFQQTSCLYNKMFLLE